MIQKKLTRNNIVLLICLLLIIFFYTILSTQRLLMRNIIFTALILSGIYSLDFAQKTRRILFVSGIITIVLVWLNYFFDNDVLGFVGFMSFFCFNMFIAAFMVRHIARSQQVTRTIIINSINGYLLIGLLGAVLLAMTQLLQKVFFNINTGSINFAGQAAEGFHDYLYFSFVTLTTLGYGDITPTSALAKSLTIIIAICGQLYLTILIAMLVGKYLSNSAKS
ncbi:MAG: two pore domain potassium channel family protein [Desulfobacterales bacterium]|nr:MAG: two pore domain potassium channel family protein [Desulfobacterales bacterium]